MSEKDDKRGYVEGYANALHDKMLKREELGRLGVRTIEQQTEFDKLVPQIEAMEELFFGFLGTTKEAWLASERKVTSDPK